MSAGAVGTAIGLVIGLSVMSGICIFYFNRKRNQYDAIREGK